MARLRQCKMTEDCLCISQLLRSIICAENQCHTQLECDYRNRATGIWKNGKRQAKRFSKHVFFFSVTAPKHDFVLFGAVLRAELCRTISHLSANIFTVSEDQKSKILDCFYFGRPYQKNWRKKVNFCLPFKIFENRSIFRKKSDFWPDFISI